LRLAGEKVAGRNVRRSILEKLGLLKQLTDANKIVRGQDVRSALSYVERARLKQALSIRLT